MLFDHLFWGEQFTEQVRVWEKISGLPGWKLLYAYTTPLPRPVELSNPVYRELLRLELEGSNPNKPLLRITPYWEEDNGTARTLPRVQAQERESSDCFGPALRAMQREAAAAASAPNLQHRRPGLHVSGEEVPEWHIHDEGPVH